MASNQQFVQVYLSPTIRKLSHVQCLLRNIISLLAIKENIWCSEFHDLLSLLPVSKEFISIIDERKDKSEEDRRLPVRRFKKFKRAKVI